MDKSNYDSACSMCLGENFVLASYFVVIVNSVIGNFGENFDDLHDGRLVFMNKRSQRSLQTKARPILQR